MQLNTVIFQGYLGADPKPINSSIPGCSLSLGLKDKDGNTNWLPVKCWNKSAEIAMRYTKKGSKVIINGRLSISKYEKNGETRKSTDIIANTIILDGGERSDTGEASNDSGWNSNNNQQGWGVQAQADAYGESKGWGQSPKNKPGGWT